VHHSFRIRAAQWRFPILLLAPGVAIAAANTISFSGTITQSTQDGTGPAANNTTLNAISAPCSVIRVREDS